MRSKKWLDGHVLQPLRRISLWGRLAVLLLPVLLLVSVAELWMTRQHALQAANSAYDRSLLGALKALDANISTESGGLAIELPYRLFEFFELTASGPVFFRIATSDGLVELGSADLPVPEKEFSDGVPVFYDAVYFGEAVRVATYRRELAQAPVGSTARSVTVQVAESTRSRADFTRKFVRSAAARDLLVLGVLLAGSVIALAVALRPLMRLAREVQARDPQDLTPLRDSNLPADVRPLVAAVNHQMTRVQTLMAQQRSFLDDASHQLRTHLTTLQMQAHYAQRSGDDSQVRLALQAVQVELDRATRTTQQLLSLGRSDAASLQRKPIDLESLVHEVAVSMLPRARERRIDLGIHAVGQQAHVDGDRDLLEEALKNLLANAIAYTPADGTVTVSSELSGQPTSMARLIVEDNGPGLNQEERAMLGQRFRRGARASDGGSGLGIAIARSIAQRHGGQLVLEERGGETGLRAVLEWPVEETK